MAASRGTLYGGGFWIAYPEAPEEVVIARLLRGRPQPSACTPEGSRRIKLECVCDLIRSHPREIEVHACAGCCLVPGGKKLLLEVLRPDTPGLYDFLLSVEEVVCCFFRQGLAPRLRVQSSLGLQIMAFQAGCSNPTGF